MFKYMNAFHQLFCHACSSQCFYRFQVQHTQQYSFLVPRAVTRSSFDVWKLFEHLWDFFRKNDFRFFLKNVDIYIFWEMFKKMFFFLWKCLILFSRKFRFFRKNMFFISIWKYVCRNFEGNYFEHSFTSKT